MTSGFEFGAGDVLAVGKLVWDVYSAYADAPEQFCNFSHEILPLHIVVRKVEHQLGASGSDAIATGSQIPAVVSLSTKDSGDLKRLYDGLQAILKQLEELIQKYNNMSENHTISFDRLEWGQENLVALKDKIRSHITLFTAFSATLAKYVRLLLAFAPYLNYARVGNLKSS